jgi:hypothetical protein
VKRKEEKKKVERKGTWCNNTDMLESSSTTMDYWISSRLKLMSRRNIFE